MRMLVNLLCEDVERQMAFYAGLFGFPEIVAARSPIYRCLDTGGSELGFNAPAARELLNLAPAPPQPPPTTAFATFVLDAPAQVDAFSRRAVELGGALLKPPFRTYYGQWQAVLADPEGHVFRLACLRLPAGAA